MKAYESFPVVRIKWENDNMMFNQVRGWGGGLGFYGQSTWKRLLCIFKQSSVFLFPLCRRQRDADGCNSCIHSLFPGLRHGASPQTDVLALVSKGDTEQWMLVSASGTFDLPEFRDRTVRQWWTYELIMVQNCLTLKGPDLLMILLNFHIAHSVYLSILISPRQDTRKYGTHAPGYLLHCWFSSNWSSFRAVIF